MNVVTRGMPVVYEFAPFRLDPTERLLMRAGDAIPLTPKAFDLLVLLVERRGRLVMKRELMSALWPDTVVEEGNLASNVSLLRKALDPGRPHSMIQTVPTRGYRFVADVVIAPGAVGWSVGWSACTTLRIRVSACTHESAPGRVLFGWL